MNKQLKFVALAALAFGFTGCGEDDANGETFQADGDSFTEGLLVEYATKSTTVTNYYIQHGDEVVNVETYGDADTDTTNGFIACAQQGNVTVETKTTGVESRRIAGKQTAYITPSQSGAEIEGNDEVLTYRDGWLDIVNPIISPTYYQNLECDCFGDPLKIAEVELYYSEFHSQESGTTTTLSKTPFADVANNRENIGDYVSTSYTGVDNELGLDGWYGLENYLWSFGIREDNTSGTGTFAATSNYPIDLQGYAVPILPQDAEVGDSWFFVSGVYESGYLMTVVAEETLTVKDADGEDREIQALHVVRRGSDQVAPAGNKLINSSCLEEVVTGEGNNEKILTVRAPNKCTETNWINRADYWFYKNMLVKYIVDHVDIVVAPGQYGFRNPITSQDGQLAGGVGNVDTCISDFPIENTTNVNAAGNVLQHYAEYRIEVHHDEAIATLVRDDATTEALFEEENAAE